MNSIILINYYTFSLDLLYTVADIDASATEVNVGDTLTITCSTKCGWHLYYLNTNALNINFLNTGNINATFQQKNQLMNCTDCDNQNQLDCSQNYKGPIQSTLNLTLYSSGTYYIQCLSHLFANSDYWPSQLFYVYSKVVKITAKEGMFNYTQEENTYNV